MILTWALAASSNIRVGEVSWSSKTVDTRIAEVLEIWTVDVGTEDIPVCRSAQKCSSRNLG